METRLGDDLAAMDVLRSIARTGSMTSKFMTPYHEVFFPIFLMGCSIAAFTSFFAGRLTGCLWPAVLLVTGVLALWLAMSVGADLGYRAWQSMPDPPEEAFSDASAAGALFLGWLPSGIFCLTIFGLVRGTRWILRWANRGVPGSKSKPVQPPAETGNPYQSPND